MKRTNLLIERSLLSVYSQKDVNPKEIFIVDDNEKKDINDDYSTEYFNIKWRVSNFRKDFFKDQFVDGIVPEWCFHTTVIPNKRTHGKSGTGAWNTALYKSIEYGKNNYIAILDDDDEWDEQYLKKCLAKTKISNKRSKKDFVLIVISGIIRREEERDIFLEINEENFHKDNFYIGNPGFQGSNLFIRLKEFIKIGFFDESLKSATDRDIALRLIEFKNSFKYPKFKFIKEFLVIHHAETKDRVSSVYENKKIGLDLFYRKYIHSMTPDVKMRSLQRAKKYFNYEYCALQTKNHANIKFSEYTGEKFNLIIGIISADLKILQELLKSFSLLNIDFLKDYRIIILENIDDEYEIRPIISYFINEKKLKIELIDLEKQKEIFENYTFNYLFKEEKINKKSIAFSRSLLQEIVYNKSHELYNHDAVAWIIDDDSLFNTLIFNEENNKVTLSNKDFFSVISYYKQTKKIDAILGTVTDAPPIPFLSSLRTQTLDLDFNLGWFAKQDPGNIFDRTLEHNLSFLKNHRDFYYDLSSEYFEHLEYPFWWYPIEGECGTIFETFNSFLEDISLIQKGVNIFRPIIMRISEWGEVISESIYRGGNTIIFNLEMLKVPNLIPNIYKNDKKLITRRSDFNWAIINKYRFNRRIYEIKIPLRHHRRLQNSTFITNLEKLTSDLYGMVFYRTVERILKKRYDEDKEKTFNNAVKLFRKKYREYINKIKINISRTEFLLKHVIDILENNKFWWYKNEYRPTLNDNIQKALYSLKSMSYEISKRKIQTFIKSIEKDAYLIKNDVYQDLIENIDKIKHVIKNKKIPIIC